MIHILKQLFTRKQEPPDQGETDLGIPIIDAHLHLPSDRYLPGSFTAPIIENIYAATRKYTPTIKKETIAATYQRNLTDHEGDELLKAMERSRVERAIILLPDFTFSLKDTGQTIEEMIAHHVRVTEKHAGRFYLFIGIDPRWGEPGLEIFKRYLETGKIHGLKVYPPCGYYPMDKRLKPYYRLCAEKRLPVVLHTGPTSPVFKSKYSEIRFIDDVAYENPGVNFILAHGGVMNVEEAVLLCAFRPNVYLDISGYLAALHPDGPIRALHSLFKRKINHKIIFGTDWPILGFKNTYNHIIDKFLHPVKGALTGISNLEKQLVLRYNILQLLESGQ